MRGCLDENEALDFVEGRLSPLLRARATAHLDECPDCRRWLAELVRGDLMTAAPTPRPLATATLSAQGDDAAALGMPILQRGEQVGRYIVIDMLGAGAVGIVYCAYDPALQREVALKVLREEGADAERHCRFLREAQAMARINHPNVVPVYDFGEANGRAFLTMELIKGTSLRCWLQSSRSLRDILTAFLGAGRGLAAAHTAGLVHRDFKPDNVLVGVDGRVCVSDFGLARHDAGGESGLRTQLGPRAGGGGDEPVPPATTDARTVTGARVGTPAYMAPEVSTGASADARADQYGFAVALYEALYGHRPLRPQSNAVIAKPEAPRRAVTALRPRLRVPSRVRALLRRALAQSPADRFADMEAVGRQLERAIKPLGAWRRLVAAAAAILLAAGLGLYMAARMTADPCGGADERFATVWSPAREQVVAEAFRATASPLAEASFAAVQRTLQRYRSEWSTTFRQSCEDTHRRAMQSPALLDSRMRCLDRGLQEVDALAGVLMTADASVVTHAAEAAAGLSTLRRCANAEALLAVAPPPERTAARVEQLEHEAAKAKALIATGRYKDAAALAAELLPQARATGYLPLVARALFAHGAAQAFSEADSDAGCRSLREAAVTAAKARDEDLAARAYLRLAYEEGIMRRHAEAAAIFLEQAEASIARLQHPVELEGLLASTQAQFAFFQDADTQATAAAAERALPLLSEALGPDHPEVMRMLEVLCLARLNSDELALAVDLAERARAMSVRVLGAEHPLTAKAYMFLGKAYSYAGETAKALEAFEQARRLFGRALGADSRYVLAPSSSMAEALIDAGRAAEALALLEPACKEIETKFQDTGDLTTCLYTKGRALIRLGRLAEARQTLEQAVAIEEKDPHRTVALLSTVLSELGLAQLEQRDHQKALATLERALALGIESRDSPGFIARTKLRLGRELYESESDRTRGLSLIREARERLAKSGGTFRTDQREADAWLANHGIAGTPTEESAP